MGLALKGKAAACLPSMPLLPLEYHETKSLIIRGNPMKELKTSNGFVFQAISIEEANAAIIVGNGVYSELKEMLLKMLPTFEQEGQKQACAFGLPHGKEIPEKDRKSVRTALASALKKANLNWSIVYSSSRKLFICAPRIRKEKVAMKPRAELDRKSILPGGPMSIIIDKAAEVFGVSREEITTKTLRLPLKTYRKAVMMVARHDFNIPPMIIGGALGITGDAIYQAETKKGSWPIGEIKKLKEALS